MSKSSMEEMFKMIIEMGSVIRRPGESDEELRKVLKEASKTSEDAWKKVPKKIPKRVEDAGFKVLMELMKGIDKEAGISPIGEDGNPIRRKKKKEPKKPTDADWFISELKKL